MSETHIHIYTEDEPAGELIGSLVRLMLGTHTAIYIPATPQGAGFARHLATEADKLADAIDARLAESSTGETRDVPMPGGAS